MVNRNNSPFKVTNDGKRSTKKQTLMSIISSVIKGGKKLNAQLTYENEAVECEILTPYGIASCGSKGMRTQVFINNDNYNTIIGVLDDDKPEVKPGEIIIYGKGGTKIKLDNTGVITITGDVKINGNVDITGNLHMV